MAHLTHGAKSRLEALKAVKVKHPRLEEVDRVISQAIEEHAGATHGLLHGPSGVGKSTVMWRITERCLEEESNRARVPVVWVEARPSDTGVYVRLDYYRQVLVALREHAAVKDRLMNLAFTTLTIDALKRDALQPAQRLRLKMEARSGEHRVAAENATSSRQLQAFLGQPMSVRSASSEGGTSSEALVAPSSKPDGHPPKEHSGRVIERAPRRDPVGETQVTLPSTKCSLKGRNDLSREGMKKTGIARVACPECATTRSLDPEASQVRFPPHDKRKTRTPSREERWIRQESVWKLAGARKGKAR